MPTIVIRDPTLIERLNKIKPTPTDYYDDVVYELLRRAEAADKKPKLSGLDDLPRMIIEEIRKSLDGKLAEALKTALMPAISSISLEVPVELKVRLRFEPILELSSSNNYNVSPPGNHSGSPASEPIITSNNNGDKDTKKSADVDELERRAIEFLREHGGCWDGSAYGLAKHVAGDARQAVWALESRLRRRLKRQDGKICLPEAAAETAVPE